MRILFVYILIFLSGAFANASVELLAQDLLHIPPQGSVAVRFQNKVSVFLDPEGQFLHQPEAVLTRTFTQTTARSSLNFGYTQDTLWLRFRLQVESDTASRLVLSFYESSLSRVTLYHNVGGRFQAVARGGGSVPPAQRSINSLGLNLMVPTPAPGVHDYVLCVEARGGLLDASYSLQPESLWMKESLTPALVFRGLFYGLLCALIISNALTWYLVRHRMHLYYVTYVASILATVGIYDGIGDWLVPWPSLGGWASLAPLFSSTVSISLFLLLTSFYEAKQRFPKMARLFQLIMLMQAVPALMNICGWTRWSFLVFNALSIPVMITILASSLYVWWSGFRAALYMVIARLTMLSFILIVMLKLHDIVPNNFFTAYAFHLAVLIEMVMVYLGLAHRLKTLETAKDKAQQSVKLATVRLDWFNTLVRVITHDMSSPISIIATTVDLELQRQQPSKFLERSLQRIQRAVRQQADLVGHVRDMIAVTTGKKALHCVPIALQEKLDGLVQNYAERIEAKQLHLQLEKPEETLYVLAEATALEHSILSNFLSNAIKFSPKGSVIRIHLSRVEDSVVVRFEDQGIGIPADLMEKLFDPTQATSRPGTDDENGTGFGLPLAFVYIEQFQGTVSVQSQVAARPGDPSGTCFEIRFPFCADRTSTRDLRISA